MRGLRRLAWAAAVTLAAGGPALGQFGGSTGTATTGGTGGGTGGGAAGGAAGTNETTLATVQAAPQIAAPSMTNTASVNTAINASNQFRQFYGNPYYQGLYTNSVNNSPPGGFGQQLFGTATGGTGGRTQGVGLAGAASGGRTGTTGGLTTSGFSTGSTLGGGGLTGGGGRAGGGGLGGTGLGGSTSGGQIVTLPRQIAYVGELKFAAPVAPPAAIQADVRGMIDRSGMIAAPQGVQVLAAGDTVVLRGRVADADEARLVEGMVRLTPGVRGVQNELTFPRP